MQGYEVVHFTMLVHVIRPIESTYDTQQQSCGKKSNSEGFGWWCQTPVLYGIGHNDQEMFGTS